MKFKHMHFWTVATKAYLYLINWLRKIKNINGEHTSSSVAIVDLKLLTLIMWKVDG